MSSQLNNSTENNDQVLQETETLRPVFFDQPAARGSASGGSSEKSKRVRLDASVLAAKNDRHLSAPGGDVPSHDDSSAGPHDPIPPSSTPLDIEHHRHHQHNHTLPHNQAHTHTHTHTPPRIHHRHILLQHHIFGGNGSGSSTVGSESASASASASTTTPASGDTSAAHSQVSPATEAPPSRLPHAHVGKKVAATAQSKAPKMFRRFRSRSLPIINYTSRAQLLQQQMYASRPPKNAEAQVGGTGITAAGAAPVPVSASSAHHKHVHPSKNLAGLAAAAPMLPPINLQSLKEIDLQEILKNPQLRHDILFDPQLQFRPNLDGDRGRRKKSVIEKYWGEIERECTQFFDVSVTSGAKPAQIHRLPALFSTLRDILLSLLPVKDRASVNEVMDMELVVQQFSHGSFDFVAMAHWLGDVFKSHCAPMRDQWVCEMISKFEEASLKNSVTTLVQGLRSIFSILEAMKLDVANHQIRILRPVLVETAVDFEKDYFNQLIGHRKIDIGDSCKWFHKSYQKAPGTVGVNDRPADDLKLVLTSAITDLLSCRNMATEFPSTLAFDHTRLVLLRADVRQLVCVQLCIVLFKQLVSNYEPAASYRAASFSSENVTRVQEEILAIVTDEHGNVKWTRNIRAIAIQLVKNVVNDPTNKSLASAKLPQPLIDFSYNWLIKQIQPCSDVYGLMESKVFKDLLTDVGQAVAAESKVGMEFKLKGKSDVKPKKKDSEMAGISSRTYTLMNFHWNVFGDIYLEYIRNHKQF